MRLHRLSVTGIGPFRGTEVIDFDELSASGLFLIEGPTGSGKTTIIDAVVYALFGVVSAGSDDVTKMRIRSHYCDETDPTGVTCEFTVDDARFRVSRVPAGVRDPQEPDKPAKSKGPRQVLEQLDGDGGPVATWSVRREVDDRISTSLGMSIDQFRQLVVLPQGQFAELLRQTPAERLRSLEPLLEDGVIAGVQADLEAQGRAARAKRVIAGAAVDEAVQQLQGRLAAWLVEMPPEVQFADTSMSDPSRRAQLADIRAALRAQADRATAAREEQVLQVAARRASAEAAEAAFALLSEVHAAREQAAERAAALHPADAELDETTAADRLADLHRLIGSLEGHAQWEGQADARADERRALVSRLGELDEATAELDGQRVLLPAAIERVDRARDEAAGVAAGLAMAAREEESVTVLLSKASALARARQEVADATSSTEEAETAERTAAARVAEAEEHWESLLSRQHADAAATLAARLEAGAACPVCGSTQHPAPAPTDGVDGVTDAAVEEARSAVTTARQQLAQAREHSQQRHGELSTRVEAVAALAGAVGDRDEQSLGAALRDAAERRAAAEEAVLTVEAAKSERETLQEQMHSLDTRAAAIATERGSLVARLEAHDAAERARRAEIQGLVGDDTATDVLAAARLRAAALSAVTQAWLRLATITSRVPHDLAAVTLEDARITATAAREECTTAEKLLTALEQEAATITATRDETEPLVAAVLTAMAHRAEVEAATATAIELAGLVTADNARRLQLRSYALQRRFSSVLTAASTHLERMSSGKFSFQLSEETARSGQSGLGITLLDSWTGHPQDPKSLSGGETFYASLALALGLADVVRSEAGGSALETLFVDEGFGSLDQDTLGQVLDQLDALRAGNRVVGVVSHVTEMKESIPDRIEVRRRPDSTSTIQRASA